MRGCKNILVHLLGTAFIVGITAYVSMPRAEREKINRKMSNMTKEKIASMKDIYEDCICE